MKTFAHGLVKVSRAKCDVCGQVYTGVMKFTVFDGGYGNGAYAVAQKIARGKVSIEVVKRAATD